ncbi:MAG: long-chain fatty acid--CoA ligase, partial [Gammaproteobacteria bacterium]|nr:long-chain fatty acid--CoA ligase [Gammaproteobacteria bacterium]
VKAYGERPVFGTKNAQGDYEWITYRELGERIDNLRGGLARVGVQRGDAVGIIANNRNEWAIAAFATYGLGARFIPMYENELEKIWKYIIDDSGIKLLLVSSPVICEKVMAMKDEIPALEKVFVIDAKGEIYRQVYGEVFETQLLVDPLIELVYNRPKPNQTMLDSLLDKVRFFCTSYDPNSDSYHFDYSLFIGMFIGALILLLTAMFITREWRRQKRQSTV